MSNDSSCGTKTCESGTIGELKFSSININSIRGKKKLELLAFLDLHQPQIVAIQETKIDSTISTSELFPETCPYNVYRKDRTLDGGGVMLLIHKDIPHMPITELENGSESVCFFFCLFELMLYVPVNSQGHVGTLPPLYGTFTQNEDVMTSNKCLK